MVIISHTVAIRHTQRLQLGHCLWGDGRSPSLEQPVASGLEYLNEAKLYISGRQLELQGNCRWKVTGRLGELIFTKSRS